MFRRRILHLWGLPTVGWVQRPRGGVLTVTAPAAWVGRDIRVSELERARGQVTDGDPPRTLELEFAHYNPLG